jgi:hypothetical protein
MRPTYALGALALAAMGVAAPTACGSRTGLGANPASDASPEASPAPALPCAGTGAPGSIAWQTPLGSAADAGGTTFVGPLAAGPDGTTYFVGSVGRYPSDYSIAALDSCGHVAWQTDGTATGPSTQARLSVLVSGDQVVVQWGAVDAFDRATGRPLWHVDLNAIAGENLGFDDQAEIGPAAASKDGTVFVVFETSSKATLLAIDPGGVASTVATTRDDGDLISLVLDADGQLDVLFNSAIDGARVESFTRAGAHAFASSFQCSAGFLGNLASGSDFLVMESGPCVMTLKGAPGFTPTPNPPDSGGFSSIVIDANDDLIVNGSDSTLARFDSTGRQRWSTKLAHYAVAGPLLGTGGTVFVVESDVGPGSSGTANVVILDGASGSVEASGPGVPATDVGVYFALLTAAQHVVVLSGNVVTAFAAGQVASPDAQWPTPLGGPDQRNAARGQ